MTADNNNRSQDRKLLAIGMLGNGRAREARELLAELSKSQADDADILLALGVADGMLGNFPAAEDSLERAASIAPGHAGIHYNLGKALKARDKPEEAVASFKTACRLEPGNAAFHNDLGNALVMLGRHREALDHIQQATTLSPGIPGYHYNRGNTLGYLGFYDQAVLAYRQAIALQPDFRAACIALGDALLGMGRLDEALSAYESLLQANPEDSGALVGKAAVLDKRRQFREAGDLLAPILDGGRVDAFAAATFAGFSHHLDREGDAIRLARDILGDTRLRTAERARLCFALGRLHDRNGEFDSAFDYYSEGNALRRSDFDARAHRDHIEQLMAAFSPEFMAHAERAKNTSELPIFIVGMPRSGTSLVEQILAEHPQVHGAGELELLASAAKQMAGRAGNTGSDSQAAHALTADTLNALAEDYLARLTAHAPNARRITDKMPANFMLLGIVDLMFPSARVIHCRRNPLDTCLSCFFQDFAGNHPYSNNLVSLGEYYLEYKRLMAHWQGLLRVPVYDIHYEELVTNAEPVVRDLVRFCNLEWDDACLDFHKSERTVATASYDQVRQPLYTSSIGRWRNYEKHIGELMHALDPQHR